jgi:hypothetical protein
MIISYVWVLETNTGATWRVAYLRIVRIDPMVKLFTHILCQAGTILGALYAYIVSDVRRFSTCTSIPTIMDVSDLASMSYEPIWSRGDGDGSCELWNVKRTCLLKWL